MRFKFEKPIILFLFFFLLLCALVPRFLIALQSPNSIAVGQAYVPSDLAVIGLMSKHVLEQGEFPFFFWGQNWFGGLEAFLHGVSFWIFGVSIFAMRMTCLFLFTVFCILTFLIARDLFNHKVALFALLWCVVAPTPLTELSIVPHTHYLETPVLGSLILWLTIRLSRPQVLELRRFLYFFLGLIGGLSWWVTPMSVYFLIAAALYMVVKDRARSIRYGLGLTLPGFFIGAMPFFIYYAMDPYSNILGMGGGFHWARIGYGFRRLVLVMVPEVLDLFKHKQLAMFAPHIVGIFYIYILVYFCMRNRNIFIFLLLAITLIYSASSYAQNNASHYVNALYSFFPIGCAYAIWEVGRKWRYLTIPIYILILFAQGSLIYAWAVKEVPTYEKRAKDFVMLIGFLKSNGLTRTYGDFYMGSTELTFMANEEVICACPMIERYGPYEEMLERAERVGFVEQKRGALAPVMRVMGGAHREDKVGSFSVYHDFEEPGRRYRQIYIDAVHGETSHQSDDIANMLDRDAQTIWESGEGKKPGMWVQFDLGKVVPKLGMIRLWNRGEDHGNYAHNISLEISLNGKEWKEVIPRTKSDFYYWSGPRIYFWEWGYRQELRFKPIEARYIRIKQYETSEKYPWRVGEVYFYEDVGERDAREGKEEIISRVKQLGLDRVYADRWISAKVREEGPGDIETVEVFTKAIEVFYERLKSRVVKWGPKVGFVLEESDADIFSKMMKDDGIELTRERYGNWELFYFDQWGEKEEKLGENDKWWWMGLGVVKVNHAQPRHSVQIQFEKGIEFLGYSLEKEEVNPGEKVKIVYYWRWRGNKKHSPAVFVHVEGQGKLFQGDYQLGKTWMGEVIRENQRITIPADIPPGEYMIGLGLYEARTGKRWKVRETSLPVKDHKVLIGKLIIRGQQKI